MECLYLFVVLLLPIVTAQNPPATSFGENT
ncbi:hypothetical protein FB466_1336 [Klugiella xanthotipulae]|uniref:Uncharacterized protein n=1 Tax=Klugiella xanthotipulae TaxID=244735 RepID=A0A543HXM0_9MICO|nr:hypothetical protein FB466_1336 [Klugiella xanthotipulae]